MFHVKQTRNFWLGPNISVQLQQGSFNGAAIWVVTTRIHPAVAWAEASLEEPTVHYWIPP